jgi:hypothetical protein
MVCVEAAGFARHSPYLLFGVVGIRMISPVAKAQRR